ncbi:MAG: diguanylate cyclase [Lysobacteraceae bacterium]|nr:MAG: diguanylate cyclase [Xanthomonadaceae bacterium]
MPQYSLLLYVVVPVWLLAGFADWLCHRRSHIERTSGATESALHLLLLAEMGIPLLAAIYLQANALVFAVLIVGALLHEATTWFDLRIATSSRRIGVLEQMIHSVLEACPMVILMLVATAEWPQFLALFGLGTEAARFDPVLNEQAPPAAYGVALAVGVALLSVGPYVEELLRARRSPHRLPAENR